MYKIILSNEAAKYYKKSSKSTLQQLKLCFEQLKLDPFDNPNIKRLHGQLSGLYRYRTGNLRVVYKIDKGLITVIIVAIGNRGDIYKH